MPPRISVPLASIGATTLLAGFMALGLIAEGALTRVDLANQEAFTSPGRTASDVVKAEGRSNG